MSSSDIGSGVAPSPSIVSTEVSATVLYDSSQINSAYSTYLFTSLDIPKLNVTKTLHASSVQISSSTLPTFNANSTTIHSTTYSAITSSSPLLHSDESNTGSYMHTSHNYYFLLHIHIQYSKIYRHSIDMHMCMQSCTHAHYTHMIVSDML